MTLLSQSNRESVKQTPVICFSHTFLHIYLVQTEEMGREKKENVIVDVFSQGVLTGVRKAVLPCCWVSPIWSRCFRPLYHLVIQVCLLWKPLGEGQQKKYLIVYFARFCLCTLSLTGNAWNRCVYGKKTFIILGALRYLIPSIYIFKAKYSHQGCIYLIKKTVIKQYCEILMQFEILNV